MFSDKLGHSDCVILRANRAKALFGLDAVHALIVASFRRNPADLRNIESGFESR
jgi:hypothetical protein